jgi:hypothetical protein
LAGFSEQYYLKAHGCGVLMGQLAYVAQETTVVSEKMAAQNQKFPDPLTKRRQFDSNPYRSSRLLYRRLTGALHQTGIIDRVGVEICTALYMAFRARYCYEDAFGGSLLSRSGIARAFYASTGCTVGNGSRFA